MRLLGPLRRLAYRLLDPYRPRKARIPAPGLSIRVPSGLFDHLPSDVPLMRHVDLSPWPPRQRPAGQCLVPGATCTPCAPHSPGEGPC